MTELDPGVEKAFDFAQDLTKQLIALCTAVIALTITFLTDVLQTAPESAVRFLQAAWVLYLVSILFGILTLMRLTGVLGKSGSGGPSINERRIRLVATVQVLCFFMGVAFTLVFGFIAA
jgi:hypothetical protein